MAEKVEKAQLLYKLARNHTWGNVYDRLEHFKRFQNRDEIIKEFSKIGWLTIKKKSGFTGISLNAQYKREIVEFIETYMPYVKGHLK